MCGILVTTSQTISGNRFEDLLRLYETRGPDAGGTRVSDEITFGHRRLAIIGLGPEGSQPYVSPAGTLAYNGEIYNYRELAAELGIKVESDTQVVFEILARGRMDLIARLRGMYAFVFWDVRRQVLTAARDPFGIKPLYRRLHSDGEMTFASTPAALAHAEGRPQLNRSAILHFLATGFFREGTSIYRDVEKLESGVIRQWTRDSRGGWLARNYRIPLTGWTLEVVPAALADSVSAHLVADVEVGVLLSGGVDSTLVAATAARQQKQLRSYSLVNPLAPALDESEYARWNAGLLGTHHTEVPATAEAMVAEVEPLLQTMAEPFGDPAYLALSLLSRRVAEDVKVTLAGEGADELFGGYRRYEIEARNATLARTAARPAINLMTRLTDLAAKSPTMRNRTLLSLAQPIGYESHLFLLANEWDAVKAAFPDGGVTAVEAAQQDWARVGDDDWSLGLPDYRAYDLRRWLPNDFLEKSDRASMLHSLEVRTPFLDPVVATAARAIPLPRNSRKEVLRHELLRLLPDVRLPAKKMGLGVDVPALMAAGLREPAESLLHDLGSPLFAAGLQRPERLNARLKQSPVLEFRMAILGVWSKLWA